MLLLKFEFNIIKFRTRHSLTITGHSICFQYLPTNEASATSSSSALPLSVASIPFEPIADSQTESSTTGSSGWLSITLFEISLICGWFWGHTLVVLMVDSTSASQHFILNSRVKQAPRIYLIVHYYEHLHHAAWSPAGNPWTDQWLDVVPHLEASPHFLFFQSNTEDTCLSLTKLVLYLALHNIFILDYYCKQHTNDTLKQEDFGVYRCHKSCIDSKGS